MGHRQYSILRLLFCCILILRITSATIYKQSSKSGPFSHFILNRNRSAKGAAQQNPSVYRKIANCDDVKLRIMPFTGFRMRASVQEKAVCLRHPFVGPKAQPQQPIMKTRIKVPKAQYRWRQFIGRK